MIVHEHLGLAELGEGKTANQQWTAMTQKERSDLISSINQKRGSTAIAPSDAEDKWMDLPSTTKKYVTDYLIPPALPNPPPSTPEEMLKAYRDVFNTIGTRLTGGSPRSLENTNFYNLFRSYYDRGDFDGSLSSPEGVMNHLMALSEMTKALDAASNPIQDPLLRNQLSELKIAIDTQTRNLLGSVEPKIRSNFSPQAERIYQNLEWSPGRRMFDYLSQGSAQYQGYKPTLRVVTFDPLVKFRNDRTFNNQVAKFNSIFRGDREALQTREPVKVPMEVKIPEIPKFEPMKPIAIETPKGVIGLEGDLNADQNGLLSQFLIKAEKVAQSNPSHEDEIKSTVFILGNAIGMHQKNELSDAQLVAAVSWADDYLNQIELEKTLLVAGILGVTGALLWFFFLKKK